MTEPTTDRPTDTIRDAFEAILHLLACLLGTVRTSHEPTAAEMIGAMGACEVFLDGYYEDTHAGLDALRDLIQRAAEEHNRRAAAGGDWTPERHREARERCDTLRIAIEAMTTEEGTDPAETLFDDVHDLTTGGQLHEDHEALIDEHRERVNALRGAWIAAREDLPAALAALDTAEMCRGSLRRGLEQASEQIAEMTAEAKTAAAEIERLTGATANYRALLAATEASGREVCDKLDQARTEIERRAAELADARAETATARRERDDFAEARDAVERLCAAELAACAPADASLEGRAKAALSAFDACPVWADDSFTGDEKELRAMIDAVRVADASRPGHPIEPLAREAGTMSPDWIRGVRAAADVAASYNRDSTHPYRLDDCILAKLNVGGEPRANEHASRPWLTEEQAREMAREAILGANGGCAIVDRVAAGYLRASRGETGPAADQVAPLPDSWRCEECKETFARCACKHGDPEHSRNLGPGIGGAPIRVRPTGLTEERIAPMASRLMIRLGVTSDHLPTIAAALREVDATYLSTYAQREGHPVNLSPDPRATLHAGDPAAVLGPGIGGAPIRVRPTAALDPLALDPEDGTLCADCKTPRNTIHGALCSLRWGKDPGRVPDPRATLHAGDPASVPDPRVDYSDSMRPAVLGGECAECLHAPPLHERTCSKVARRPQ